jgi:carbamoyl-phosphate synthase large subunit
MINNILITSAGRRVSLVKNFQDTLKSFNINGKVYTTDMNPEFSSACQISDGYCKVPRVTDSNYIKILKEYCLCNNISMVIPTIDTELHILASNKNIFEDINVNVIVSSKEICETFYLKDSTEEFFVNNNFDTPKGITNLDTCLYPIFAKLNNSSCSIGAQIVDSAETAKELLEKDKNYIFQELINAEEYTVDVFINKLSEVISIVPRQRLEVRAGEVSKAKAVKDRRIINAVKLLCSKLKGAYGCITIQLFKTEDRIIFIEINPRFGGGYPLSFLSGANFAEYLIKDFLQQKLAYNEDWTDQRIMLRYDAEVII